MMHRSKNRSLVVKLMLVSVSTFAFGVFAMPPLYDKFCEITGIGQAGVRVAEAAEAPATGGESRSIKLLLDANSNSALPWEFAPVERSIAVQLGEASLTHYTVHNLAETEIAGRAVYNVTPPEAARYFVKTECFCFSRQTLAGGESREMPVRFYIDPELPADIHDITLSYTFFLNKEQAAAGDERNAGEPVPN